MQKNQQNHSTLSRDITNLLFHRILGMRDYIKLNGRIKLVSIDV